MSALGHKRTSRNVRVVSAIPLKADIHQRDLHVRLVPKAGLKLYSLNMVVRAFTRIVRLGEYGHEPSSTK